MPSQDETKRPSAAASLADSRRCHGHLVAVLAEAVGDGQGAGREADHGADLQAWLALEAGLDDSQMLLVDTLGRCNFGQGAFWNSPPAVAKAHIAVATTSEAGGLNIPLRQFFVTMAQFGLRQGLLLVLPDSAVLARRRSVSAAAWSAIADNIAATAAELGFERLEALPLEQDEDDRLKIASWFNGAKILDMLRAPPEKEAPLTGQPAAPLRLQVLEDADGAAGGISVKRLSGHLAQRTDCVVLPDATLTSVQLRKDSGDRQEDDNIRLSLDPAVKVVAGQVVAQREGRPEVADQMAVHLIWAGAEPMLPGRPYVATLNGQRAIAQISTLKYRLNVENADHMAADKLRAGEIGYCNLSLDVPIVFDPYKTCRAYGVIEIRDKANGAKLGLAIIAHGLRRATNIHWQALAVNREERAALKGQRPCCLWFTGLSGSGKSTVASLLEKRLQSLGRHTYTLDGDNVRHGLNRDLGFTDVDRVENIRRIGEVSKLFVDAGLIVMCSFISPFRAERRMVRNLFSANEFIEIFVDTPLEICEKRDIKGLYQKARSGALKNFTGIDSPYEPPERAEMTLAAGADDPEAMVEQVVEELQRRKIL